MPGESAIHPQKGDSVAPSRLFYLIEAQALARAAGSQAMFSLLLNRSCARFLIQIKI